MKTLTAIVFMGGFLVARWLRWLAIAQQKEYRLDRLKLFLSTRQGRREFIKLFFRPQELNITGLKRPQLTARILVVLVGSLLWSLLVGGILVWLVNPTEFWLQVSWWLAILLIIYLLLPLLIIISIFPTWLVAEVMTRWSLSRAQQLLAKTKPTIIGITGSYGKSTTKHLLTHILAVEADTFTTPRSYNTRYSVAKSILDGYRGQKFVILEYGAYGPGEIKALAKWIQPQVAVITGFAPQHLGLFGSQETIVKAKSELIKALPDDGRVIANLAQPGVVQIIEAGGRAGAISFTEATQDLKFSLDGDGYLIIEAGGQKKKTNLLGDFAEQTVRGAVAVVTSLGMDQQQILDQVSSFEPGPNFVKKYQSKTHSNLEVIDDGGTSNPAGFSVALDLLKHLVRRDMRTILVTSGIVDLGSESDHIHLGLAKQADFCDQVWYLGEVGLVEFKKQFGEKLGQISGPSDLPPLAEKKTVLLIEGRVPVWIYKYLGVNDGRHLQ